MTTVSKTREIISDIAAQIKKRKTPAATPGERVINFRNEKAEKFERQIVDIPIELLKFRKDNGRIGVEVSSYERKFGKLKESAEETQEKLYQWLKDKDPGRTEKLYNLIRKSGQEEPAVATADGFLIDGNRRLMVLRQLNKLEAAEEFSRMRVVLLPGEGDPGGPPTIEEIEKLENTYQLQDDGKSEYSKFAKALSYRRKDLNGYSLRQQVADDPNFYKRPVAIDKEVRSIEKQYLQPLVVIDRYLSLFGLDGQYDHAETRWETFLQYSLVYHANLNHDKKKHDLAGVLLEKLDEFEAGVFTVIRAQKLDALSSSLDRYMRRLKSLCKSERFVEEFCTLGDEISNLDHCEDNNEWLATRVDEKTNVYTRINHIVSRANEFGTDKEKAETPLSLLEQAERKLTHKSMRVENIAAQNLATFRNLIERISGELQRLQKELYDRQKSGADAS